MVPPWASPFSPRSTADQVRLGRPEPVRISSKGGDAVLISAEDFDSWQETIYLLRSPANARRLMEAVARDKSHQPAVVKTMEDLQALAGE